MRKCIFVIGMHRSGTSVMAGCLRQSGISLGSNLMDGDTYNAKGYFENTKVYEINELILGALGKSWHSIDYLQLNWEESVKTLNIKETLKNFIVGEFGGQKIFAIKDPRFCFLFPIWKVALDELDISLSVIICRRNVLETINSIVRRDRFSVGKAMQIWTNHSLSLEENTRGENRCFVTLQDLLESPAKVIKSISEDLEIDFGNDIDDLKEKLESFVDMNLVHNSSLLQGRLPAFFDQIGRIEANIGKIAEGKNREAAYKALDKYGEDYRMFTDFFFQIHQGRVRLEVAKLEAERKAHRSELALLQSEMNNVRVSLESIVENLKLDLSIANTAKLYFARDLDRVRAELMSAEQETHNLRKNNKELNEELKSTTENLHKEEASRKALESANQQWEIKTKSLDRDIEDLRRSFSFQLGWILTRPFGVIYDLGKSFFQASESKVWLFWRLLLLGISQPANLFKHFSIDNLKVLKSSLSEEPARLILSNVKKKFTYGEVLPELEIKQEAGEAELLAEYVLSIDVPVLRSSPLISIIIVTRDGLEHLRRFSEAFKRNTLYKNYELIFVDNDSRDHSCEFLKEAFPLATIIHNSSNESFSRANNQGVEVSQGEFVLFVNNDIAPLYGWVTQMLFEFERNEDNAIGSVGAKLIYPMNHIVTPCRLQHRGIKFNFSKDFIRPINIGQGEDPRLIQESREVIANTAACLLLKKKVFEDVHGFDEGYIYGYEDVDLGLKLITAGYTNICCASAYAFHHEFGTQKGNSSTEVRLRRLNNIAVLKKKWGPQIKERYWSDILEGKTSEYSEDQLSIGIIVTDSDPLSKAGDTYTGLELKLSLEKLGWKVVLISRIDDEWKRLPSGLHCVISLLDSWPLSEAVCDNHSLIRIAWCRNWFENWANQPDFPRYDLILTSSRTSMNLLEKRTAAPVHYFPIATNPQRFESGVFTSPLSSDYCFTGSYWKDHRQIMDFLEPSKLKGVSGSIFGYNWKGVEKFEGIYKGPISYDEIPNVYASTKLLIDDANRVTRDWGSVNSRVFDALGSGTMVITNGVKGAEDLFEGLLPTFQSEGELTALVKDLLSNNGKRKKLVGRLQSMVLSTHTYDHRASEIKSILSGFLMMRSMMIKVPAPSWDQVKEWGDYHMARELQKSFRKHSIRTKIQILPEWHDTTDVDLEYVLVMRGLSRYEPKGHHFNMMWNISHPDKIELEEYEDYDHVFVASIAYADILRSKLKTTVSCLLQCTSPDAFYPSSDPVSNQILFVGNSRKVFRRIVKDLIPTDHELSIYGTNWQSLIDEKYIKGEHIPNEELHRYYTGTKILLNDHWDSMKEKGFISNRIFDALACGAIVISDKVRGLEKVVGDMVYTYEGREGLRELIEQLLNSERDDGKSKEMAALVASMHSFDCRAEEILKLMDTHRMEKSSNAKQNQNLV